MRLNRFLLCILVFFNFCALAAPYTINVSESYRDHAALERLFTILYAPLTIQPKFVYYPSKRGLRLVNEGRLDAEAGRFHMVAKNYINLVRVEEPINILHTGYYCIEKSRCDITPETVVVVDSSFQSATLFCQNNALTCLVESNPNLIAKSLEKNIAQVFLSEVNGALTVLCMLETQQVFYKNIPKFANFSYHYVHKKHAGIVSALEQSMRQMKESGQISTGALASRLAQNACGKTISLL